jgi:hypothetical protein
MTVGPTCQCYLISLSPYCFLPILSVPHNLPWRTTSTVSRGPASLSSLELAELPARGRSRGLGAPSQAARRRSWNSEAAKAGGASSSLLCSSTSSYSPLYANKSPPKCSPSLPPTPPSSLLQLVFQPPLPSEVTGERTCGDDNGRIQAHHLLIQFLCSGLEAAQLRGWRMRHP